MKWESADLRVGAAVLAVVALLASATVWLAGARGRDDGDLYAEFSRVDGVAAQAPVQLGGYTVGRVESIEPHADSVGNIRFRVTMRVQWRLPSGARLPLSSGARARVVPPPVTVAGNLLSGVIALEPGAPGGALLAAGATLPGESSAPAFDQAQALVVSLGEDMQRTLAAVRALTDTLARTSRAVATSSAAVERSALATGRAMPALTASVTREMASADSLVRDARRLTAAMATLVPEASAGIDSAQKAFAASRQLAGDASIALSARDAELARVLARMDTTTVLLNHFVRQVSRNPVRALTGVRPPKMPAVAAPASGATAAASDPRP
jgi:MlaD protein